MAAVLVPVVRSRGGNALATGFLRGWLSALARDRPEETLRRLYAIEDLVQPRIDEAAISLDGGVHAKHRIMRYHDFFAARISAGERVLDVGCGKGELASDLVRRAGARVTAIDVNREALAFARTRFASDDLEIIEADALEWQSPEKFDVVVLSNVLEHIDDRVGFLQRLARVARPSRVLIRVPMLERDWQVVLRRELGLTYFSDPGHFTEYSPEQLESELRQAGFKIVELEQRWGELWAVAVTAGS